MKLAIVDDYLRCARDLADWKPIAERAEITVFDQPLGASAPTALAPFDVLCLMRDRQPCRADLLAALPRLKFVSFTGKSNATFDVKAATENGIAVSFTDRGVSESTVELIWALIMAVARRIPSEDRAMREGRWQSELGVTLAGKTLGIVGLGRLGAPIAKLGRAFAMNVIAWSPNLTAERAAAAGAAKAERDELFQNADFVTIHMPLSERSRGLIGAREIGLMKKSAYLINTSRGPIVDERALVEALAAHAIAGAGLDVYDQEPLPSDHPLRGMPNTVLLPHLGFVTRENMALFYADTVENVLAWLDGKPIRLANPDVLGRPNLRR